MPLRIPGQNGTAGLDTLYLPADPPWGVRNRASAAAYFQAAGDYESAIADQRVAPLLGPLENQGDTIQAQADLAQGLEDQDNQSSRAADAVTVLLDNPAAAQYAGIDSSMDTSGGHLQQAPVNWPGGPTLSSPPPEGDPGGGDPGGGPPQV